MNLGRQVGGERYPHRDEALVIMVISTNCLVTVFVVNVGSDLQVSYNRFSDQEIDPCLWVSPNEEMHSRNLCQMSLKSFIVF